jgi:HD-like signal output (HDOD) protein
VVNKKEIIETIWSRMDERGDFPTMGRDLATIVEAMKDKEASAHELAQAVLSDFSLTQKVIRLANSAMYSAFGGDVTTVTRAVFVLGVEAIGYLAMGLQMFDEFAGLAQGREAANAELRRAMVAGNFTRQITMARGAHEAEEAVVCTMMRHAARLLLVFYLPDEWQQIESRMKASGCSVSSACEDVLGTSLDEIALESARRWGLPYDIAQSMNPVRLLPDSPLTTHGEWLKAVATVAGDVAELLDGEADPQAVSRTIAECANWIGIDADLIRAAVQTAADYSHRLKAGSGIPGDTLHDDAHDVHAHVVRGLSEVRAAVPSVDIKTLAPLCIETIVHALKLQRAIGFFLNRERKQYEARVGFGADVPEKLPRLSFDQAFVPDLFHIASTQRTVTFIPDARAKAIYQRLPEWHRAELTDARSLLLIPIHLRGGCIGMIYGDWGVTQQAGFSDSTLACIYLFAEEIAKGFERRMLGVDRVT